MCPIKRVQGIASFPSVRWTLGGLRPAQRNPCPSRLAGGRKLELMTAPLRAPVSRRAIALMIFFEAVLPANVRASKAGIQLRGRPATPLALRLPMQVLFIGLTWWAGICCPG
jgi:hypothetical protein